jgi:hypothetical protein
MDEEILFQPANWLEVLCVGFVFAVITATAIWLW